MAIRRASPNPPPPACGRKSTSTAGSAAGSSYSRKMVHTKGPSPKCSCIRARIQSVCTHCTGDQKNAPSLGLVIIKNMQRNGFVYQKGSILDPRDGHVYQAKLTLSPDGQSLTLRGYFGIELLGKDQVWRRLPNDALTKDEVPLNLVPYWLALQKTSGGMMTKDGGPPYTGSTKPLQLRR